MKTTVLAAVFLAISLSISGNPISQANQETPQIETKKESKGSVQDQQDSKQAKSHSPSTNVTVTDNHNSANDSENNRDEETEYWPPFLVFRIKVTDSFLVLFTAVLAVFTGLLWRSTQMLWKKTRATSAIAEKAAKAAERSADIANKSLSIAQRAFVFGIGFNSVPHFWDNKIKEYVFWVDWENVGITPATHVQSWIDVQTFPIVENREPNFIKSNQTGSYTVLGPRSKAKSAYKLFQSQQ